MDHLSGKNNEAMALSSIAKSSRPRESGIDDHLAASSRLMRVENMLNVFGWNTTAYLKGTGFLTPMRVSWGRFKAPCASHKLIETNKGENIN